MKLGGEIFPILRLCQNRPVNRHDRHTKFFGVLLNHQVSHPSLWRWLQDTLRGVGRILQSLVRSINSDELLDLGVVRFQVLVGNRPIKSQPIPRIRLEIVGSVPQRNPPPVIGPPPHHPGPPPHELFFGLITRLGIGFVRHLPPPINGGVEEPKILIRCRNPAERSVFSGLKHRGLFLHVIRSSRLQHETFDSSKGERIGHLAASGTGTDDNDIVFRLGFGNGNSGHG